MLRQHQQTWKTLQGNGASKPSKKEVTTRANKQGPRERGREGETGRGERDRKKQEDLEFRLQDLGRASLA